MTKVKRIDAFDVTVLKELFERKILAVRIPSYLSQRQANAIKVIVQKYEAANYTHEIYKNDKIIEQNYGVSRIGSPFNRVGNDHGRLSDYFKEAAKHKSLLTDGMPNGTPLDKFQDDIAAAGWQGGATIAQKINTDGTQKLMGTGLIRITRPEESFLEKPHIDFLPEEAFNRDGQFSVNFYASVPDEGGELVIYDHAPLKPSAMKELEADGKAWKKFLQTAEPHVIKPQENEMIFINTTFAHAVLAHKKSQAPRISMQSFVGYAGPSEPLRLWV